MDRSEVVTLIAQTYEQNEYGVLESHETQRNIFVQVTSVTGTEWFEGGRNGLNPELRFIAFAPDYQDEKILEYNGNRYTIYRTYISRNDTIELYTERRKGNE